MLKHIKYFYLFASILLIHYPLKAETYTGGSASYPTEVECSSCYSTSDATNLIRNNMTMNTSGYFLVYNVGAGNLYTVFGVYVWEPELGMNILQANIVANSAANASAFTDYKNWFDSGAQKSDRELDWPDTTGTGGLAPRRDSYDSQLTQGIYQEFVRVNVALGPLSWKKVGLIKLKYIDFG